MALSRGDKGEAKMVTMTYTCDKCKKEVDGGDICRVELRVQFLQYRSDYKTPDKASEWCRECVERAGFLPVRIITQEEVKPATLEDIIREIVQQEVQAIKQ